MNKDDLQPFYDLQEIANFYLKQAEKGEINPDVVKTVGDFIQTFSKLSLNSKTCPAGFEKRNGMCVPMKGK